MAAAVDGRHLEGVGQAVERQGAGDGNDVTAVNDSPAEPAVPGRVLVKMDPGRILIKARRHHVFGFLDGHAAHMIDFLPRLVVLPEVRASGELVVIRPRVQPRRRHQVGGGDGFGQVGDHRLGRRGRCVALVDHHPTHVFDNHSPILVDAGGAHVGHPGPGVGIFLETDDPRAGAQGIAGKDRFAETAIGVTQVGYRVQGYVGHGLAENHMEDQQIVHGRGLEADALGEGVGRLHGEPRTIKGGVQGHVAAG